jgi:hypothetical protein
MSTAIRPVEKRLQLVLPPAEAFVLFTRDLTRWWPLRAHSCGGENASSVKIDPWVGSEVVEYGRHGERHAWGTVTEWDPPRAFAMTWHPGQPPELATRVRVCFSPLPGGGSELHLCHDGWEVRDAGVRARYEGGWQGVLQHFAGFATQQESGGAHAAS